MSYFYAFDSNMSQDLGMSVVCVVEKGFFEQHGSLNDVLDEDVKEKLSDLGFMEEMEATFEIERSKKETETMLNGIDVFYSQDLQDFLDNMGE